MPGTEHHEPVLRFRAGDWLVRLIIPAWIAAGATLKLLTGSPLDLPVFMLDIPAWLFRVGIRQKSYDQAGFQVMLAVVAVEYLLAVFIALHPRWSRRLAIFTLMGFIAILLMQIRSGATGCGCMGTIGFTPTSMLLIDGAMLLGVLVLPRRDRGAGVRASARRWGIITTLGVLLVGATWLTFSRGWVGRLGDPAKLIELDLLRARGRTWDSLLLFDQLPKKPSDFPESSQVWVIYRETCPVCHALFRDQFSEPVEGRRVVAVLVPAFPQLSPEVRASLEPIQCAGCEHVSLPEGRGYSIATPLVVRIEGGKVVDVTRVRS